MNEKRKGQREILPKKTQKTFRRHILERVSERELCMMANYDNQMAERVWKRVQGNREDPEKELNLKKLIMDEQMAAASYLQLARQLGGETAQLLQQMAREEKSHAACLAGMYILTDGGDPQIRFSRPGGESPELMLRRAYAGELRSIAAYEALADHPEYGHVFSAMAQQERHHSRAVLEILGKLEEKKAASGKNHGSRRNI